MTISLLGIETQIFPEVLDIGFTLVEQAIYQALIGLNILCTVKEYIVCTHLVMLMETVLVMSEFATI